VEIACVVDTDVVVVVERLDDRSGMGEGVGVIGLSNSTGIVVVSGVRRSFAGAPIPVVAGAVVDKSKDSGIVVVNVPVAMDVVGVVLVSGPVVSDGGGVVAVVDSVVDVDGLAAVAVVVRDVLVVEVGTTAEMAVGRVVVELTGMVEMLGAIAGTAGGAEGELANAPDGCTAALRNSTTKRMSGVRCGRTGIGATPSRGRRWSPQHGIPALLLSAVYVSRPPVVHTHHTLEGRSSYSLLGLLRTPQSDAPHIGGMSAKIGRPTAAPRFTRFRRARGHFTTIRWSCAILDSAGEFMGAVKAPERA